LAGTHLSAGPLFALDFHDPKLYASTFTPDGVLDYGDVRGRHAVIKVIAVVPRRQRQSAAQ
jgi:hypothetical protein